MDLDNELFGDFEVVNSTGCSGKLGASSADTPAARSKTAAKTTAKTSRFYSVTQTSSRSRIEVGVWDCQWIGDPERQG